MLGKDTVKASLVYVDQVLAASLRKFIITLSLLNGRLRCRSSGGGRNDFLAWPSAYVWYFDRLGH